MSDAEAREFEALLAEKGYELADSWRWRLAHCGMPELGPVLWYVSPDRRVAVGTHPSCGIAGWCEACERRRAARGRRRLEAALAGRKVEMWTLTVPGAPTARQRRSVLLDAWSRLRRVSGVRQWGWGAELVPPTHWHLHCLVPLGTADRLGRHYCPWEKRSWSGWRWLWGELVALAWQRAGMGVYPEWVPTGWGREKRPYASALVSAREGEFARACRYVAKYASKPAGGVGSSMRVGYVADIWKQRRVCIYRRAPRPPRWTPVPQRLAPAEPGQLDGREASQLAERVGEHAAEVRQILEGQYRASR